ncbi:MAG: T9SS type A sorting domain-containing protein [Saprospiraceae bacterium]|nr:T9SS type A sorting domain-containing protein [Candidatus Opimibacter skivensis]
MKLILLLLTFIFPCLLHGQFTLQQRLSESDSISYLPYNNSNAISVIGQVVHIVYTDRRDGAGEVFYKRSLDGGMSWDTDKRLTEDDNVFSGRATIAAWNNQIHIVWMDRRDGNNELYYKRSTNNGNTWSDDVRLTNDGAISEYPSMALEFQTLHLVWNDSRNGNHEIYYKRSINGGLSWTADTRITNNTGDSYKPSVAVSDTLVHVLWEDLRNSTSEIFYKTSQNNGNSWSNDMKLSNSASDCYAPCISANGTIAFATWDDNRTANSQVYGRRTIDGGSTWKPEINYANTAGEAYSAYHSFSGTYLSMVYNVSFNDDPDIYGRYSTDAGVNWAGFGGLSNNFSADENPFVAIAGATAHVIWQDDYEDNLQIYYTRNLTATPLDHQHTSAWANHINSTQTDVAYAMTSDPSSNVYVTGSFSGTVDFDPGPGEVLLTSLGSTDAFVYKLDPFGDLLWAKQVGGPQTDIAFDIVVDNNRDIVITGSFHTIVDFDPGVDVVNIGSLGQEDIFVLKLDKNGNYVWANRMGGGSRDEPRSIDINASNDIVITGYFEETSDFDPGPNNVNLTSNGEEDIWIASLNSSGEYMWAKSIGGIGFDRSQDLTIDAESNIVITGYFHNMVDFDPGNGEQLLSSFGGSEIFILKLIPSGELDWVHRFGSVLDDEGHGITTDQGGNIYATGSFSDKVDFHPTGIYFLEAEDESDIYTLRLLPQGDFSWAQRAGGSGFDEGSAIAYSNDAVYVTGTFESIGEFHPGVETVSLRSSGNSDIFLQKLDAMDGDHLWLNQFGGTMQDVALDVHPVPYGKVGVTGYFEGTADFSPNIDQQTFISAGEEDGFVTLVSECVPSYADLELTGCIGDDIIIGDSIITQSGVYTLILQSSSGCDSVVTLMLTILESPETSVTETACDSYTTPDGSQTWTESGIYMEVLESANGCDSIVTYNLTIRSSSAHTEVVQACDMYTTPDGDILTQSGVYVFQYINEAGCDSVLTIDLEIIDFQATIMLSEITLTAGPTGSSYQWLDCDQNFALIEGETEQTYTPAMSGTYAALVNSVVGCVDTTACITVMLVSAEDPEIHPEITIYPNPAKEQLFIDLTENIGFTELILTDLQGKRIMMSSHAGDNHIALDLAIPVGMYFLTVMTGDEQRTFKLVKM